VAGEPIIYSLNWIPIGGFVSIKGENGENENEGDSFGYQPIWKRNIILSAGVTMNLVLCVVLLSIGFAVGMPSALIEGDGGKLVSEPKVQVAQTFDGWPAKEAGIAVGDVIISVDGQPIKNSEQFKSYLAQKENTAVAITVKNGVESVKTIKPISKNGMVGIGVSIIDAGVVRYPVHLAIWKGILATWGWLSMIGLAFVALFKQLFGGASAGLELSGPVGIAVMTGQAAKLGWIYLLQFTALLSLNLAIINILPFPALDGGRILFLTIGKIRGKMIASKWENLSHNLGFILLMALVVFITYKDIIKYGAKILQAVGRSFGF
jgi:regulator of sigma E protease